MRTFDVALIGTGGIAAVHAAELAKLAPRVRIAAAVETDPLRGKEFADRWAVTRLHRDLDELTDWVDLVVLCTPPHLHYEQAKTLLERGMHVLCEKPPAISLSELDALAAVAKGRFATVSQHRFGSGAVMLRRLVAESALGRSMTAVCHTLWYRPDEYFDAPWRASWKTEGGGPTLGHGIHQMDLMLSILGDWQEVAAVATRRARPTETEDLSAAVVTLADGTVMSVVNSLLSPRETSYLRLDFERCTVELSHLYGYSDADWRLTPAPGYEGTVEPLWAPQGHSSGHAAQYAAVLDALESGTEPPVEAAQARRTLELITAIYASAYLRRPVRRGEIGAGSPFYTRMDGGFGVAADSRLG